MSEYHELSIMARLPSLNGLRAFEAAARHLSFTLAASELNVTQTAISHQIKRLEDEIGLKLFVRKNRTLALTPAARDYLPGVRTAFQDLRFATERLMRRDDDHVLAVSTLASLAAKWLLPRLAGFQREHPEIDVRLSTSTALVDFVRDDVDAAIRFGRGPFPGLRADWLMTGELMPVCSPALASGDKPLRQPQDLVRHVLLHSDGFQDDWRLWLTAAGVQVDLSKNHALTLDLAFMTIQAAIDGLGVAISRRSFVENDIAAGRLIVPFDIVLPSDAGFYFVCPEANAAKPKIAAFRSWLLRSIAER